MLDFLRPRHVSRGRAFIKDARKLLAYKRDLWSAATVADFEHGIGRLEGACAAGSKRQIEESAAALDKQVGSYMPPVANPGWRENCEVFLVAIVIALAVRTYFLQPFTIPTGSMQPTLNGILGEATKEPPPNVLVRIAQVAAFGRSWVDVTAREAETVATVEEKSRFQFFTYSRVHTDRNSYWIHSPARQLHDVFGVLIGRTYEAGEPIARGYIDTGDHVFVDKFTYHFRHPRRGDVFVFNTQNIPQMGDPGPPPRKPSQFYIKRLAGLPGDELRIDAPLLYVNGKLAEGRAFESVMSMKEGYGGYANGARMNFPILSHPDTPFLIPPRNYMALGDNSYHSSDSRHWGPVRQENLMGRGLLVYWPFTSHFGRIR